MKTANLTFMFLLLGWVTMFAQIQKGSTYLAPIQLNHGAFGVAGDKISVNLETGDGSDVFNADIMLPIGYTLSKNLLLWGALGINHSQVSGTEDSEMDLQLNARVYANPGAKNDHFFVEVGGRSYFNLEDIGNKPLWGYKAMIGLTHFLAPSVALEVMAGHQQFEDEGYFGVNSGFAIFLNKDQKNTTEPAESPLQKGTWMLGHGLLNINFLADDNRAFSLSPNISYFLNPNLAAGFSLNYNNVNLGESDISISNWIIEPQVRYYISNKPKMGFFVTAGGGTNIMSMNWGESKDSESEYFWGAGLGLNSFIGQAFALEFGPNIRNYPNLKTNRIGFDFGIKMFL